MSSVIILGLAQDGGVPQIGCRCENCLTIDDGRGWAVSVVMVDWPSKQYWFIDATPNFSSQYNYMCAQYPDLKLAGIFLTHAHIGHYTGLMFLGREAMNAQQLPVYGSPKMHQFLSTNAPWSMLLELNNIHFQEIADQQSITLTPQLAISAQTVHHRSEFSDTFSFFIKGDNHQLFYCPDIDDWEHTPPPLNARLKEGDHALLDATFFSGDELPGRDISKIPHPLVHQTIDFTKDGEFTTWMIHLNHSNPLWAKGPERTWLDSQGACIPSFAQIWDL